MFSDDITKILNVIFIKKKIADRVPGSKWIKDMDHRIDSDPDLKEVVSILEGRVRNIEIIYNDHY